MGSSNLSKSMTETYRFQRRLVLKVNRRKKTTTNGMRWKIWNLTWTTMTTSGDISLILFGVILGIVLVFKVYCGNTTVFQLLCPHALYLVSSVSLFFLHSFLLLICMLVLSNVSSLLTT